MSQDQEQQSSLPPQQMMMMINGLWLSQSLGATARLGIADQIAVGPKSSEEIAKAVGANPDAAHRFIRALAGVGVCREVQGDRFGLTEFGHALRSNVPGWVRAFAIAQTDQRHWQSWGRMLEGVKTGRPAAKG